METEKNQETQPKMGKVWKFVKIALVLAVGIFVWKWLAGGSDDQSRSYSSYSDTELDESLVYQEDDENGGCVKDRWTGRVILKDLSWLSYEAGDSLVAYARKNRRGYLNLRSRKSTLLDEKFIKVYLYSEGRAMAESRDSLYILDTNQHVVGSYGKTGERDTEVNTFHKGHLPMLGDNGKMGLIDTLGHWAVEPQYDKVAWALEEFWLGITNPVMVDEETGKEMPPHRIVMDSKLRTVMEGDWTYLMMTRDGYITVGDRNHWQWHYALDGSVIDDFVCESIDQMEFTTGEKRWVKSSDDSDEVQQVDVVEYATLLKYTTSDSWEGLMTRDGKIVTPPVFWSITAISRNLYLCSYDTSGSHKVLINEKGERVRG